MSPSRIALRVAALLCLALAGLLLLGATPGPDSPSNRRRPTPTPLPTATVVPTNTPQPTATPVPTSTAVPTATPLPTATATPIATPTHDAATATPPPATATLTPPTPSPVVGGASPTPTPAVDTIGGVPVCTDHDPRAWHPLVKRDSAGALVCTYTHEHKDDPKALDYAFGPLPAYLGGEISYPWQTQNATTGALENDAKHRVYGWQVVDEPSCVSSTDGHGLRRMRLEQHEDGPLGATVRFHSFWGQFEFCNPDGSSAYLETGGWLDTGSLFIDSPACPGLKYIAVPGDNGPESVEQRLEGTVDCPRLTSTWYARRPGVANLFVGLIKEAWGPVDPNNLAATLFYGGTLNGSAQEPAHIVSLFADTTDTGGTYTGHTDRAGNLVNCTTLGPDCVPLVERGIQGGVEYQFRADMGGITEREYDVIVNGVSLTRYPN